MTKHQFTSAERHAIFTVHGGVCYLCDAPVTISCPTIQRIEGHGPSLGLSEDFEVNSYDNWVPTCRGCILKKLGMVWTPSLQIQRTLQRAHSPLRRAS